MITLKITLVSLPYIETIFNSIDEKSRWYALDGKKIFITGGTGFFGKWWLACYLYAKANLKIKSKITILSRFPDRFLSQFPECDIEDISWCTGDIADYTFPEDNFDYILHMARSYAADSVKDPITQFYSIVIGMKQILEMALRCSKCTVLFISSGAVYGEYSHSVSENLPSKVGPTNAANSYIIGKLAAEQLCALYHKQHSLDVKIARCFSFLGPFLQINTHFAAGNFIYNVIKDEDIIIKSDGSAVRSYMYPSDLINWLMAIMIQGKPITPYNVGSFNQISILDLANSILETSDKNLRCIVKNDSSAVKHRSFYVPDTSFTEKSLNIKSKINLKQSIQTTINWNVLYPPAE